MKKVFNLHSEKSFKKFPLYTIGGIVLVVLTSLVIVFLITGGSDMFVNNPAPENADIGEANPNNSNLANSGYSLVVNDRVFVSVSPLIVKSEDYIKSYSNGIFSMELNGGKQENICSNIGFWLNSDGTKLYFVNLSEDSNIYSMNFDGSELTRLYKGKTHGLIYDDGYLYFVDTGDRKLKRMKTDGSGVKVLQSGVSASHLNISGDRIFFHGGSGNKKDIRSIDKAGKMSFAEGVGDVFGLQIYDGWLYYIDPNKDYKLFRKAPLTKNKPEQVCDVSMHHYNISGDTIFYMSNDESLLWKMSTSDSYGAKFGDFFVRTVNIVNNKLIASNGTRLLLISEEGKKLLDFTAE